MIDAVVLQVEGFLCLLFTQVGTPMEADKHNACNDAGQGVEEAMSSFHDSTSMSQSLAQ